MAGVVDILKYIRKGTTIPWFFTGNDKALTTRVNSYHLYSRILASFWIKKFLVRITFRGEQVRLCDAGECSGGLFGRNLFEFSRLFGRIEWVGDTFLGLKCNFKEGNICEIAGWRYIVEGWKIGAKYRRKIKWSCYR